MSSLFKRYFEITPVNNVENFTPDDGVDIINFIVPPVNGASLPLSDLVLVGNLKVFKDYTANPPTPYQNSPQADGNRPEVAIDNVAGIHGAIARVDITSRQGNILAEQRQNYSLVSKWQRGTLGDKDLQVGRYNVQQCVGANSRNVSNRLRSSANLPGDEFCFQLNTGILKDANQPINLQAFGGMEIKIHLNSTNQFLMNIDSGAVGANLLQTYNYSYRLTNVRLFGRYNYVEPAVLSKLNGLSYKAVTNNLNTVQSSNDTMSFGPQVNSLDKVVYIFQPNNATKNNPDVNGVSCNQLISLKEYQVSNNGQRFPYDMDLVVNPSLTDQTDANSGSQSTATDAQAEQRQRQIGDAEIMYHFITGLNGNYPPTHSMVSAKNYAQSIRDLSGLDSNTAPTKQTNFHGNNVQGICTSYQYGFDGYATPMPNNLIQLQAESSVLTNQVISAAGTDPLTGIRDQVQTENAFIVYNADLSYSGMRTKK